MLFADRSPVVRRDLARRPRRQMTSQGSAHVRFARAILRRNLFGAETAMHELSSVTLLDALDYFALLAELRPEKERAAVRWNGGSRRRRGR